MSIMSHGDSESMTKWVEVGLFRRTLKGVGRYPALHFLMAIASLAMGSFWGTSHASENSPLGPSRFSATVLSTFNGRTTRARFWIEGKKVRIEPEMTGSSMSGMYEILTQGDKAVYVVMPSQHMCMKQGLSPQTEAQLLSVQKKDEKEMTVTVLGHETVDGHPTVVRKVVFHPHNRPATTSRIWNALDLKNVPVKQVIDTGNGMHGTILYRNISLARPDPALFVPPAHCGGIPGLGSLGSMVPHLPSGSQFHLP